MVSLREEIFLTTKQKMNEKEHHNTNNNKIWTGFENKNTLK